MESVLPGYDEPPHIILSHSAQSLFENWLSLQQQKSHTPLIDSYLGPPVVDNTSAGTGGVATAGALAKGGCVPAALGAVDALAVGGLAAARAVSNRLRTCAAARNTSMRTSAS